MYYDETSRSLHERALVHGWTQVAEAMNIYFSDDNLLNGKNEYLSYNIVRVTVDIDKYDRKKKELEEEKQALEASMIF